MNAVTPSSDTNKATSGNSVCNQAAGPPTSRVLDVEGLVNRCMGNIELAQRVLEKFRQRLPEELAELEEALRLGDVEKLARTAHRIRGSSATMSAEGLATAAAGVEDAGRQGRASDIPLCIERLRDEWSKLVELPTDAFVGR
jgi:HPt (histidine-containing phosphotransfer) domain-containing protein